MKKIHTFIATTGASPQVVTETLYAIHQANQQWPDDIYLITTSFGKTKAVQGLLEQGHLQRLCSELKRPMPRFDVNCILVVPGADAQEVEDARSLEDHEALADFIMTTVRDITAKRHTSLHASLAGGRKTMTFYIGYAMSLFGRPQDVLSHVLVSEGYENLPGFWFPTEAAAHRELKTRDDKTLDASQAEVTLAPIPFVRHRRDLPPVMLQEQERVSFSRLVQLINLGESPEQLRLIIDLRDKSISLKTDAGETLTALRPSLINLAFYAMLARATVDGETDFTRPSKGKLDTGLARLWVDELLSICHCLPATSLEEGLNRLTDTDKIKSNSLDKVAMGMSSTAFDQRRNELGRDFAQVLPASLARWLTPRIIWTEDGERLPKEAIDSTPKGGGYGIALEAEQIEMIEA